MSHKKLMIDRRERIIDAANSLFNHYGYEKTTMEDISRESGVPRATLYLEFSGGKDDILMASIERYFGQLLSTMREMAKVSRSGRLDTLKQVILYNILSNYDRAIAFRYAPVNPEPYSNRVRTEMASFFRARLNFFAELLQQAIMSGEISIEYNCLRLAEIISFGMGPFMPPGSNRLSRDQLESNATAFFILLLSGIAKNQSALRL